MPVDQGRFGPKKIAYAGGKPQPQTRPQKLSRSSTGFSQVPRFLFLPHGRLSRSGYWIWTLATIGWKWIAGYIAGWILFDLVGGSRIQAAMAAAQPNQKFTVHVASGGTVFAVYALLMGPVLWIGLMMFCKRIHDFNGRPWVRVLILLLPIFGALWVLYELFLKPGDEGPNDYD